MRIERLSEAGGIVIRGIAVNSSASDAAEIAELFDEHGLILFPDQQLDEDGVIAAASLFGGAAAQPRCRKRMSRPRPSR